MAQTFGGVIPLDYQTLANYLPVVIYGVIAILFGVVSISLGFIFRPSRPDPAKLSPYECGCPPVGDARERFSIHFYIIAMLFVLFDLEAVFMYPWAINYGWLGLFGLVEMLIFISILLVGYLYAWKKGALEWDL